MFDLDADHIASDIDAEADEYLRMQLSLLLYRPRDEVATAILAAYNDKTWDWRSCDGCTGVNELHFPRGLRFPPCTMHDHQCELARRGLTTRWAGDKLFFKAMVDYRVPLFRLPPRFRDSAIGRWCGVRLYWLSWQKWREKLSDVPSAIYPVFIVIVGRGIESFPLIAVSSIAILIAFIV